MTAPVVTAISPAGGALAGGVSVVITGTTFTAATAVNFGAIAATSYNVDSATQITAVAPAHVGGTVDITVTTAGGTSATGSADHFLYVAVPTITSVSPSAGPIAGGNSVVIAGTGFTSVTGASSVRFGATNATSYVVNSDVQITAVVPALSSGTVDVIVTNVTGPNVTGVPDNYRADPIPTISSLSAVTGNDNGGETITITGTGLSHVTAVKFGTVNATSFVVNSSTTIHAVTPAIPAGAVSLTVVCPGGTSSGTTFTYQIIASETYAQPDGNNVGVSYFQDVAINPATLASGALRKRFDTVVYPKRGVIHEPKEGVAGVQPSAPIPGV